MESRRLYAKATNGSSCATDHCTANLRRNIAPITRIKKAGRLNPRGTTCTVLAPPKAPAQGGTVLGLSVPQSLRTATRPTLGLLRTIPRRIYPSVVWASEVR
jgi:hypothetical protein